MWSEAKYCTTYLGIQRPGQTIFLDAQHTSSWWRVWEHLPNSVNNHHMPAVIWGVEQRYGGR
jgi:hypothetical protein